MKRELRTYRSDITASGDGNTLSGYIALFNTRSEDLGGFYEVLASGCFSSSMGSEIKCLVNHNTSACVGNTKSGTLRLKQDDKGLAFEVSLPDTSFARDLKVSVDRRDLSGCSFGFYCLDDDWVNEGQTIVRTVKDVQLFEVSVGVSFPAYTDTTSQLRSLFPDGMVEKRLTDMPNAQGCSCDCANCVAGDCQSCTDPDCVEENCLANMRSLRDRLLVASLPLL